MIDIRIDSYTNNSLIQISNIFSQYRFCIQEIFLDSSEYNCMYKIELLLNTLMEETKQIYLQYTARLLNIFDNNYFVENEKEKYVSRGVNLKVYKKLKINILTYIGEIYLTRSILRPYNKENLEKMKKLSDNNNVVPLDKKLGLNNIYFKVTSKMMIEIAFWAIQLKSYEQTEKIMLNKFGFKVSDTRIRKIVNFLGEKVYNEDMRLAQEAKQIYENNLLPCKFSEDDVLFIMVDGSFIQTKNKDSKFKENKLSVVFRKSDIKYWIGKNGKIRDKILKREFISCIGKN